MKGRLAAFLWLVTVIILSILLKAYARGDECFGPVVELEADGQGPKFGVLGGFGSNLSEPLASLPLVAAIPADACGELETASVAGAAVVVVRGNCTFTDKAAAVQAAGGVAMLLYDSQAGGCVTMGFEPNATSSLTLAAVSIPHELGLQLLALAASGGSGGGAGEARVSLRRVSVPLVDAGALLLWFLAVGTVIAGSLWGGLDHMGHRRSAEDQAPLIRAAPKPAAAETVDLTPKAALAFVGLASCMLLLLYFVLNKAFFYVLLVLFCVASVQSQTVLYAAALGQLLPPARRHAQVQLPWLGATPLTVVATLPLAVAVAAVWAVWRNSTWAWVLQDLQGVALMLLVLRTLRVPSLKVACILLPACLAYDVFWVFIQPLLFGGGESVMVHVAQGGSSGEYIPMLLRVPHFGFGGLGGYSLLGFGDVILPGLLVAYTRRTDLDLGLAGASAGASTAAAAVQHLLKASYFPYTVLSYGAGLCLTYAALAFSWFGDQGQPALLYLVPCTLGTVLALAAARGQLGLLWRGAQGPGGRLGAGDHDSDAGEEGAGAGGAGVGGPGAAGVAGSGAGQAGPLAGLAAGVADEDGDVEAGGRGIGGAHRSSGTVSSMARARG
ncbi:hypothetical protein HXX76_003568 [Chlamydomonas incerta]|uniref:PA domain-containing protein n=1 Tax=Chlamydomonas incerta TaxID=51695 RepID=A0A835W926_CHLIN|nr:hypothetical protein HXX76_003568 [Chlamydomonas incerta]|eukprot:KAG2440711.1 hypothetical protein HXX76_003568 [Chlamydomonas incerta]